MKKLITLLVFFIPVLLNGAFEKASPGIFFTENKGQFSDQYYKPRPDILFGANDGVLAVHFKDHGVSYQQYRVDEWIEDKDPKSGKLFKVAGKTSIYRLDINFLNINTKVNIEKQDLLPGYSNYYLEVCPNGINNVRSYKSILYKSIYNGIDLKWYEKNGHLKYDYIVALGGDHKQIKLAYNGAEKIFINAKGELVIKTPLGEIIEEAPYVTQEGKKIKAFWQLKGNVASFYIPDHDPALTLLIDPGVRQWGTYYGADVGMGCATDNTGNVYMTGYTGAGFMVATVGSHQSVFGGGGFDAFLVKFNNSGVRLWGTYYGGGSDDIGFGCCTDNLNNVYICGQTASTDAVASPGGHQTIFGGGMWDAFLVKFDSAGVRQWGTYYGALNEDNGYSCAADLFGNVYLTGKTTAPSGTIIASPGAHQTTYYLFEEAFLAKFDANGVRQWGTYYGEMEVDIAYSCITDAAGNVYMAGTSNSTINIGTPGTHKPNHSDGGTTTDAFLVKFNGSGIRQWGTYYGGTGTDEAFGCAIEPSGDIYITGKTNTYFDGNNIAIDGAHQTNFGGGLFDAFLAKFDNYGTRIWSTYCGGPGVDAAYNCALNSAGDIYIAGYTTTNGGLSIATPGSHQSAYAGGIYDAFITQFNSLGQRQWGSYYGGTATEIGRYCATDNSNNVYMVGITSSNSCTCIATPGSFQSAGGGAYLVRFFDCPEPAFPLNITPPVNQTFCAGNSATLSATSSGTINWYAAPFGGISLNTGSNYISPTLTPGTYTYYAEANTCTNSVARTPITVTVNTLPYIFVSTSSTLICDGQTATLSSSGVSSYTWNTGPNTSSLIINPGVTTTYTIYGTDGNGCVNYNTVTQNVSICTGINVFGSPDEHFKLSPNPNNGNFNIDFGKKYTDAAITITNILGQMIFKKEILNSKNADVELSNHQGLYFVNVVLAGGKMITVKVLIQ